MNRPTASAAKAPTGGALPVWDLSDLYEGMSAPEIEADLQQASAAAEDFSQTYKGRLAKLPGDRLGDAIAAYEVISERLEKLLSYGQLLSAADVSNTEIARFTQTLNERVADISTQLLFFTLEINRINQQDLEAQLTHDKAARYGPWLRDLRSFLPHQLSDDLERLLHEKTLTGRSAWARLFEETLADLRFVVDDRSLSISEAMNLLSDVDEGKRKRAAMAVSRVLKENVRLLAQITNTLAKDKAIEDGWRRYAAPVSARNLANLVEDHVVEALVDSVRAAYGDLAHRYYALKARWFKVEQLNHWDRNAPLPGGDETTYTWEQARRLVLEAYGAFSPLMGELAGKFFDNAWIDAPARPGKMSGAFSHPTVPSAHPYILLNFHGKARDVMTLAHELGHGVHQLLAAGQGALLAETPLTLAETASVFGEMLVFRHLLAEEDDPVRRRILLASKVEDMLNTVVRQVAFHFFETRVHARRASGELSSRQLGEIWLETQRESLGPSIRLDEDYAIYWSYIPHFVHTPFYVYAYAFGDCLVNSLYAVFQAGQAGFHDKYLDMLRAGGTLRHKELLAPFGLDASKPAFWREGLTLVTGMIDELEVLE